MFKRMRIHALITLLFFVTAPPVPAELLVAGFSGNHIKRFDANTGDPLDVYVPDDANGLSLPHELLFGPDLDLYVCSAGNDSTNPGRQRSSASFTRART